MTRYTLAHALGNVNDFPFVIRNFGLDMHRLSLDRLIDGISPRHRLFGCNVYANN